MKTQMLVLTLSLTFAWLGSTALAQNTTENPPTVPADVKPKPPPKSGAKTHAPAKLTKKDDTKREEPKALTPGPAVVKEKNVNVRGKAAINSEVVSRLKRGDHIVVLEEVTLKNPKTDEPARWAKIALPTNAPVWVHTSFIDSNKKTVIPKRLNLRGGPGENYSVIGQITNGTAVTEIETKGEWARIEPPPHSYAFVAAHLIANEAAPPVAIASTEVPKPTPTPVIATPPPAPVNPLPAPVQTEVATAKPPVVGADPVVNTPPPATPVVATPPVVAAPPPVEPTPIAAAPPENIIKPSPQPATPAGPPKVDPDEDVKRVVTREGIVKRSVSIQAPTYFVLENLGNGKTINYLYSPSTNLVLKDFWGKRVMVSGEEELDERWPTTPVITVDKLETVP